MRERASGVGLAEGAAIPWGIGAARPCPRLDPANGSHALSECRDTSGIRAHQPLALLMWTRGRKRWASDLLHAERFGLEVWGKRDGQI